MTQVEIKITINTQDSDQITALNELFRVIGGNTKPVEKVETPVEKVETPAVKVETPAAKVETPTPEEEEIKIEEVRALLAKKVENNRSEIKTKLTALGAPNVTALAKDKYPEFVEFLNGLK